ncbi:MAG: hypothetical protein KDK70_16620 [Myxococcales bacterium]|nr:hypothetical protein [Myxococcales bacterium]
MDDPHPLPTGKPPLDDASTRREADPRAPAVRMHPRRFYRRSGVVALWLWTFVFHAMLLVVATLLPDGWTFLVPPGSLWIATSTLVFGALGLLATGRLTGGGAQAQDRYTEYVLDPSRETLSFTPNHERLSAETWRQPWYPRWPPDPALAASSKSIYAPELLALPTWRRYYEVTNFIELSDVERAEETDRGLALEVERTLQRVSLPLDWPGIPRLREDIAAWEHADDADDASMICGHHEANGRLVLIIDNRRFFPGARQATFVVHAGNEVYGYGAMKAAIAELLRRAGVPVAGLRAEPRGAWATISLALVAVPLVAFATTADALVRDWWVTLLELIIPIALTANYRHLGWMRGRWEMAIVIVLPLTLLHAGAIL